VKFLSNDYTNPNIKPKTLMTLLKGFGYGYFGTLYGAIPAPSTVH